MKQTVYELMVGNETIIFGSESDAMCAAYALLRGVQTQCAANPLNKSAKMAVVPCEVRVRKCEVDLPRGALGLTPARDAPTLNGISLLLN